MRGSLNKQIEAALKQISRIGESRHQVKVANGGKSPFIHSVGTYEKTFQRLRPFGSWLRGRGFRDLERITPMILDEYLQHRLAHNDSCGNSRKTMQAEMSALMTLGRALAAFTEAFRIIPVDYDLEPVRQRFALLAKKLPLKTSGYQNRAAKNPERVISNLGSHKHQLMARLQWESGARAEGVGAPQRGSNPLRIDNFHDPETGRTLGIVTDPVTQQPAAPLWTKEKGGKVAFKFCSPGLRTDLIDYLAEHDAEGLASHYSRYLGDVNQALSKAEEAAKGRGTHGFRFAYAQRRYSECLQADYTDEQAKYCVAQEMSHNRADITETYLK